MSGGAARLLSRVLWLAIPAFLPVVFMPFARNPFGAVKEDAFMLLGLAQLAVLAVRDGGSLRPIAGRLVRLPVVWPVLAFAGLAAGREALAGAGSADWPAFLALVVGAALGLALAAEDERGLGRRMLAAFLAGAAGAAGYGAVQFAGRDPLVWQRAFAGGAPGSSLGNPLFLGTVLAAAIPVTLAFWLEAGSRRAVAGLFALLGLETIVLIMAQARGAWAGAALASALVIAWRGRGTGGATGKLAAWGVVAVACLVALARPGLAGGAGPVAHAASLFSPGGGQWRGRFLMWEATARMARERPLAGWGTGGVGTRYLEFQGVLLATPRYADQPYRSTAHSHQDWLQFLAERGTAGLGIFLWLVAAAAARARGAARAPASRGAACALAGWLVDGMVNGPLHVPPSSALCWIFLGIAVRDDDAAGRTTGAGRAAGAGSPAPAPVRTRSGRLALAVAAVLVVSARGAGRDLAGEAYLQSGVVRLEGGEPARALPYLARAAALALEDRRHHFEAGRAWFLLGSYGDAVREFEADVALNPAVHSGWHNLGLGLLKLERREEALAAFRKAEALNPRDADTRRMIGAARGTPMRGKL